MLLSFSKYYDTIFLCTCKAHISEPNPFGVRFGGLALTTPGARQTGSIKFCVSIKYGEKKKT